jgi:sugar phosphate isomerase/epimerase
MASSRSSRLLSLAAGTILEVSPAEAVSVAVAAGWPAVGVWFDAATWSASVAADVVKRLDDTGMIALDIEPFIFGRGAVHGPAMIEAAAQVGARFLLVASGGADPSAVADGLGALSELAAASAPDLMLVLEFLPIFSVSTLVQAASIVTELGRPNLGVLVDTLHLARSGGTAADLRSFDPALFPYLQLADAPLVLADPSMAGLREEALFGRLLPGEGELALAEMLQAIPEVPISVELRSRPLCEQFSDPVERARRVLAATRLSLSSA